MYINMREAQPYSEVSEGYDSEDEIVPKRRPTRSEPAPRMVVKEESSSDDDGLLYLPGTQFLSEETGAATRRRHCDQIG
jgi:hypothetical protein